MIHSDTMMNTYLTIITVLFTDFIFRLIICENYFQLYVLKNIFNLFVQTKQKAYIHQRLLDQLFRRDI